MLLLIDPDAKEAYGSLYGANASERLEIPDWQQGETRPLTVGIVSRIANPIGARLLEPKAIWPTLRAAAGRTGQPPIAGEFTLSFDGDTTVSLAFDATAVQIEDALNDLASMTAVGGVTVSGERGVFTFTFNSDGAQEDIEGDADELSPVTTLDFGVLHPGTGSSQEVQTMQMSQSAAAMTTLTIANDPAGAGVEVVQVGGGGNNHQVRVSLTTRNSGALVTGATYTIVRFVAGDSFTNVGAASNSTGITFVATGTTPTTWTNLSVLQRQDAMMPYDGQFSVTVAAVASANVDWDVNEADLKTAIEAIAGVGAGNTLVNQEQEGVYLVTFVAGKANTDMGAITANGSALRVIQTLSGNLDLRTAAIAIMAANRCKTLVFEIEGTPQTGTVRKIFRDETALEASIMGPNSEVPPPLGDGQITSAVAFLAGSTLTLNGTLGGTPTGGTFNLANVTLTGLDAVFATPPPIGVSQPNSAQFTNLYADGTVNFPFLPTAPTDAGALWVDVDGFVRWSEGA